MAPMPSSICCFSSNNFVFSLKLQQHFDFFHACAHLIWPSPTHEFLSTSYRIPSIFATAQRLWANNPSPHRFSIDFHWVSTCLSVYPPTHPLFHPIWAWSPLICITNHSTNLSGFPHLSVHPSAKSTWALCPLSVWGLSPVHLLSPSGDFHICFRQCIFILIFLDTSVPPQPSRAHP